MFNLGYQVSEPWGSVVIAASCCEKGSIMDYYEEDTEETCDSCGEEGEVCPSCTYCFACCQCCGCSDPCCPCEGEKRGTP